MESQYWKIDEVAHELSVSVATIRNWIRSGRIKDFHKEGKVLLFNKKEIETLKLDIAEGTSNRLKSRRNKKMVQGNIIPSEYVTYKPYLGAIEDILVIAKKMKHEQAVSLVLLEIALHFLLQRKKVECKGVEPESLVGRMVREELMIPSSIQKNLLRLYDIRSGTISEEDIGFLSEIRSIELPFVEGEDFLGLAYMSLAASKERKTSGQYYTPSKVVDVTIQQNAEKVYQRKIGESLKVVDPCCGSGNFLIKVFLWLKQELLSEGHSVQEAEELLIKESIVGYDINPIAVALCSINLLLLTETNEITSEPKITCKNTLFEHAPSLFTVNEEFDWVIGNPPWGYSFSDQEKQELKAAFLTSGDSIESFSLFIEASIDMLKQGGTLTFVLPESILNIKVHGTIREFILKNTMIEDITLLGREFSNVFTNTLTLTLLKDKVETHKVKVIDSEKVYEVSQQLFLSNDHFIFNVLSDNEIQKVLDHIRAFENVFYLKDKIHAEYALGIVTGDNKKYVSNEQLENMEPILTGKDIFKFNYVHSGKFVEFLPSEFQQVAPERLYRAPEKLFYRFINKELIFAYDDRKTLSLNSANILIPKHDQYSVKYVMAVLNSRVAQFFHTFMFSPLKVLKSHIESIPIPMCTDEEQAEVVELVKLLLESRDEVERLELYNQLDELISGLYELDEDTKLLIKEKVEDSKFLTGKNK
ncbi:TaqI-like C-terminal specificity domain-containing protein [Bacillus carboniphilus]|uniref:site-specific DNA-methyltransferase (adenine-specific) n=1 Tax=Bacillus carboniphilus TaxID=86663 RepID=A0ABP3FXJ5_9BACI